MGTARMAPGLALLLCCPVLSSAYALVSHSPRTGRRRGDPGAAWGSPGRSAVAGSLACLQASELGRVAPHTPGFSVAAAARFGVS